MKINTLLVSVIFLLSVRAITSEATKMRSPQTVGPVNVTTVQYSDSNVVPPDPDGVVGPTQFVTAVNGRVRTNSKFTGAPDGILNTSLNNFFSSVTGGNQTTDPHVIYDRFSARWYITCITDTTTTANSILLAVSNSQDITAGTIWSFFALKQDTIPPVGDAGRIFDFPQTGIDVNALYIGGNIFAPNEGPFFSSMGVVIQKSSVLNGGPLVATAFRAIAGNGVFFTPQGVNNDDPGATQGYFVGNINASNLGLVIISNPGSTTPTASSVIPMPIPTVAEPLNVPAKGSVQPLDANDMRIGSSVHITQNQMWLAQSIGVNGSGGSTSPDRTGVRWYQYDMTTPTSPSLVQMGTVFDPSASNPLFYWMPSIRMSGQGHMAMGFSLAGTTHYADAGTVGRLSGDPTGTVGTIVQYTMSTTPYNNGSRWGDFSITSLDPNDNMTMWTIQEWCNATNSSACQVAQLMAPPPSEVSSATPPIVTRGLASVLVTINGSSINGEGFYEPGPSFANHLTALVSGGVIVNSVTYVSPIQIILDLNTQVASSGVKTIVIKNPDGQTKFGNVLIVI